MDRAYKDLLLDQLSMFPCVAVIGPRQCGKTTLVKQLGKRWKYFDLERQSDISALEPDPDLFLRLNTDQIVIDEAQLCPALFPALRVAIDADRSKKGRFVITGSSSPNLLHSVSETLAGRMAIIEMSPLLWSEVHPAPSNDFISRLGTGMVDPTRLLEDLAPRASIKKTHTYWFRGGYPEPWLEKNPVFSERWSDQYVQSYLQRDVARLFPKLNHSRFRHFMQLLAGYSGQIINYSEVARALGVSQPTARDYLEIAHGTFLWRHIPAYHHQSLKRIVKHPKGYFRDSGLLHQLLRIPKLDNLLGHPKAGASWEGMVIEEILRQFNVLGIKVEASHYRTGGGAEVDLICEGRFGTLPFEVKHGQRVDRRDLRSLSNFIQEKHCPLGIVINNDEAPRRYTETIIGLPFSYL